MASASLSISIVSIGYGIELMDEPV
ncbi:hypothetical protein F383_09098 [Gossypium arboreum]|uniref:Uncharacterized protein n=1 Tax=Gossypium arboreum TaxID=29729 RepID=A0A0B0PK09_GOSAR|nr:hypothetical protein F383_09098 [Gossypium arboreum]